MNLARSTYYEEPATQRIEEAIIVEKIAEICAEFPRCGYRRVTDHHRPLWGLIFAILGH